MKLPKVGGCPRAHTTSQRSHTGEFWTISKSQHTKIIQHHTTQYKSYTLKFWQKSKSLYITIQSPHTLELRKVSKSYTYCMQKSREKSQSPQNWEFPWKINFSTGIYVHIKVETFLLDLVGHKLCHASRTILLWAFLSLYTSRISILYLEEVHTKFIVYDILFCFSVNLYLDGKDNRGKIQIIALRCYDTVNINQI